MIAVIKDTTALFFEHDHDSEKCCAVHAAAWWDMSLAEALEAGRNRNQGVSPQGLWDALRARKVWRSVWPTERDWPYHLPTINQFLNEEPQFNGLVCLTQHLVAVIDGVVHDMKHGPVNPSGRHRLRGAFRYVPK